MKTPKLILIACILFVTTQMRSQTCTAGFTYSLSPNGAITFTNTSVHANSLTPVYYWELGDATATTTNVNQTLNHTYTSNGKYQVILTMSMSIPNLCWSTAVDSITVIISGCPLSAGFSVTGSGATVQFSSTSTGTTSNTTYTWNFGDGATSNAVNPTHIYGANGIYLYTLTASNNATCTSFKNIWYYPAYWGPTYICSYIPALTYTAGTAGQTTINVSDMGKYGVESNLNFGDTVLRFNAAVDSYTHAYFNGTYTISTWLKIGPSCTYTPTAVITITNSPCLANAAFTYTSLLGGLVNFSKSAPPGNNIAYYWNFGDGFTSTLPNPSHTFASAGNYNVKLTSYSSHYSITPYPVATPLAPNPFHIPCKDVNVTNLNINNIPCVANSNFSIVPMGIPHDYYIIPDNPYAITSAVWDWGDGGSTNMLNTMHTYSAAGNYSICLTVTVNCGASSTTCSYQYLAKGAPADMVHVTVKMPELIDALPETQEREIPKIYPVPSEGLINVNYPGIDNIEITDVSGKVVYVSGTTDKRDNELINLEHLSNGIYFLQIRTANKKENSKIILSK